MVVFHDRERSDKAAAAYRPEHGLLASLLQQASRDLTARYDQALRPAQITLAPCQALQAALALHPVSGTATAKALRVSPQAVIPALRSLEVRGLIERTPGPGRTLYIHPTDRGRAINDHAARLLDAADTRLSEYVALADLAALLETLLSAVHAAPTTRPARLAGM